MRLLGKDISPAKVMQLVGDQLAARGLSMPNAAHAAEAHVEPSVDPLSFNLKALEDNADATQGLPLETHRGGLFGRAVVFAKWAFRTAGQTFINETLGRQRVFNGHVRDSYAQLSAEVIRLRQRLAELEAKQRDARPAFTQVAEALVVAQPVVAMPDLTEPAPLPAPEDVATPIKAKKPKSKAALEAVESEARPKKPMPKIKLVSTPVAEPRPPTHRATRRGK